MPVQPPSILTVTNLLTATGFLPQEGKNIVRPRPALQRKTIDEQDTYLEVFFF